MAGAQGSWKADSPVGVGNSSEEYSFVARSSRGVDVSRMGSSEADDSRAADIAVWVA